MIAEFAVVAAWALSGAVMLRACGLREWVTWPLGLVTGLSVYFALGTLQVATPLPDHPALAFAATAVVALVFAGWRAARLSEMVPAWRSSVLALGVIAVVVALTRTFHVVRWHVDTFEYFKVAALMTQGHLDDATFVDAVDKRLIAVPMMHAPALWWGEWYMRSITPLLGLACIAIVVWLTRTGVAGRVGTRLGWVIPALAGLALAATNRFQFHSFYLNGHLLAATFLVTLVGCAWLYLDSAHVAKPGLIAVMMAASAGLVVTRPEGGLLAGLALIPFVVSERATRRHRALVLFATGLALVTWHGYAVGIQVRLFELVPRSSVGYVVIGLGVVAVGLLLLRGLPTPLPPWLPSAVELGLLLMLVALVVHDATIFLASMPGVTQMFTPMASAWGGSLLAFYGIALTVLASLRFAHQRVLSYPFTTFLVLMMVLAYAREGRYHAGSFDSLIRMFIEVVPVMVLFIAIGATRGVWRYAAR